MLKVAIADVSSESRDELKQLLSQVNNVSIIGESDNEEGLLKIISTFKPNVLFIEIELHESNGIDVAKKINMLSPLTSIIFMTSQEKYLKEAFEVYAYDYLIKPLQLQRVIQTLNRISNFETHKLAPFSNDKSTKTTDVLSKIFIESEGKSYIVNIADIIFITRYDRKVLLITENQSYSIWSSIENLEKRLPENFFRSHKGYIININFINEINLMSKNTYQVYFRDCSETALMTMDKSKLLKEKYCL